ncbi:MAG TPA: DUF2171 domain-containing protein [Sphingomicrobium sp.]
MAYDRYDRDERSRWSDDRNDRGFRGDNRSSGRDDRGFWDRASDEVSSWFGDEDAERRRRQDQARDDRESGDRGSRERSAFGRGWDNRSDPSSGRDYDRGYGRDYDRDRAGFRNEQRERDQHRERGIFNRGGSSERDYNRHWEENFDRNPSSSDRGYRPMAGDYGRGDHESDQFFAVSGVGRGERGFGDYDRSQSPYGRDEHRRTSSAGSRQQDRDFDPHYSNWRDRHMSDLDRDYDDYQREHQSKFENDFTSWREKRQHKRGLLGQIREHMEVVGSDGEHVGKVDKTAGDRLILAKSDPDSGGTHHSLSCSDIDRVEGDKVILDCKADEAKHRWRDESRSRALFEREDQGEMGPRGLDRSFSGTYR